MSGSGFVKISVLFGLLALTGCEYTIGSGQKIPEDLSCKSDVLGQTIEFKADETLYGYKTNKGEPYYGLTRESKTIQQDKAVTTTTETTTEIKMYDHDRWRCTNGAGDAIDYKTFKPL